MRARRDSAPNLLIRRRGEYAQTVRCCSSPLLAVLRNLAEFGSVRCGCCQSLLSTQGAVVPVECMRSLEADRPSLRLVTTLLLRSIGYTPLM